MPPTETLPTVTGALAFFRQVLEQGRTVLGANVIELFKLLIVLEFIFIGLYIAIAGGFNIQSTLKRMLSIGFLYWVITNYDWLLRLVLQGFLDVGSQATGASGVSIATLQQPDIIFRSGLAALQPALDKLFLSGSSWIPSISLDWLLILPPLILSVLCFGIMTAQVFVTYLEYLLISAVGFALIPFGVFGPLTYLAERVTQAIITLGIKLLVLALIIGISEQFVKKMGLPAEVTWAQLYQFNVVAISLAYLSFHAPSLAASLLTGSPQLSFATAAATAAASSRVGAATAGAPAAMMSGAMSASTALGSTYGGIRGRIEGRSHEVAKEQAAGRGPSSGVASKVDSAIRATAAVVAGPSVALGKAVADRLVHGTDAQRSGATGKTMSGLGLDSTAKGFSGAANRAKFANQSYRYKQTDQKKSKQDSKTDSPAGNQPSRDGKAPSEPSSPTQPE